MKQQEKSNLIFINTFKIDSETQEKLAHILKESMTNVISKQEGFLDGDVFKGKDKESVVVFARWKSLKDIEATKNNPDNLVYLKQIQKLGAKPSPSVYEIF